MDRITTRDELFDTHHIRGGFLSGTVGVETGRVFQASKVWSIRKIENERC